MGESSITGPDLIRDTSEKVSLIRQRLLTAQSRQKSYADVQRRPLEFEVGDHVFLKVMPKREVVRPEKNSIFLKNGKTVISVENRKFSRSRMTKRTPPLNSSNEI